MRRGLVYSVLAVGLYVCGMFAQTNYATLGGSVSDASGALIPGVTVTARNIDTGIVTTLLSNESGSYQFAALQTARKSDGNWNLQPGQASVRPKSTSTVYRLHSSQ
jgi:hypothetical protein